MKEDCENQSGKINNYRRIPEEDESTRNCCFQVEPEDINSTMRGINAKTKEKGIEVREELLD